MDCGPRLGPGRLGSPRASPGLSGVVPTVGPVSTDPALASPHQVSFDELGTPLREVMFVVVDLETTGGSPADCAITEIGAVRTRAGRSWASSRRW